MTDGPEDSPAQPEASGNQQLGPPNVIDAGAVPESQPPSAHVVDLSKAPEPPVQQVAVQPMSMLQQAGIDLAVRVIFLIGIAGGLLLGIVAAAELIQPPAEIAAVQHLLDRTAYCNGGSCSPETLKQTTELLDRLVALRRGTRDFWMSLSQLFLLNLLLPVLTAILGYVFGQASSNASK